MITLDFADFAAANSGLEAGAVTVATPAVAHRVEVSDTKCSSLLDLAVVTEITRYKLDKPMLSSEHNARLKINDVLSSLPKLSCTHS